MKQEPKKQAFIIFQNNRIQSHNEDCSILQCKQSQIIYITPKGIKNILSLDQIHRSKDLTQKLRHCLDLFNLYSNEDYYIDLEAMGISTSSIQQNKQKQTNVYKRMTIKVNEFAWQNPQIQQTKNGYRLSSDCSLASVQLHKNLYIIQVNYLQYVRSSKAYVTKTPNMTKLLLQKYNHQYAQFPIMPIEKQNPSYFYIKVKKLFNIFNIPKSWRYPLHLIWNSLIKYSIIPHQFCYIQYRQDQMCVKTSMPTIKTFKNMVQNTQINMNHSQNSQQALALPILGKINHPDKCLFMLIGEYKGWLDYKDRRDMSFFYDGCGFWFCFNNSVHYRTKNKRDFDQQFHIKAIPFVIRLKNEPQRVLVNQLRIYLSYLLQSEQQSLVKEHKLRHEQKSCKFDNENNLVAQQSILQIGHFKAFSNGIIIVKFIDRCLITLNSKRMEIKMMSKNGESCYIDLNNTQSFNYQANKHYVSHAVDFQERTFYPQEWAKKQQINQNIRQYLQNTQTFQKTNSIYLNL